MLNFSSILISTGNPKGMTEFYERVFQKPIDKYDGWLVGNAYIAVLEHSEIKGKNKEGARVMFNLETADVKGEFERIKDVPGAEVIKEPYTMDAAPGMWIATFADPDGNYFQLMSPWEPQD